MTVQIEREPVSFKSTGGSATIRGYIWRDVEEEAPRGIVQIVHGMCEHIGRYDKFARFLASNGFIVAGHSHIGHGESVESADQLGNLPGKNGAETMIEDVQAMRLLVEEMTPQDLPYFIFGHSMGSFITRAYITRYGDDLAGAIIAGTGHIPLLKSKSGRKLTQLVGAVRGEDHKSKLLEALSTGGFIKKVKDPRTPADWLSTDEAYIDTYIADEACGFMFSAGGNTALTTLTAEVCSKKSAAKIPHELPLLYIAGGDDPVGDMGVGVQIAAEMAVKAGVEDVDIRIYEGMRHEVLNEINSEIVYEDVLDWLVEHLRKHRIRKNLQERG